eukprot:CAMPEP_0197290994 /NCGR_PEP_ID=MMETSP0890-20130614/10557_1 /TAXON_ID=44058 ORGANISM="Aureoumbra lagunensis, Strain CCMP1510" /NCGR_SAMPLE_ID=MMETSP0890 /ASSEMBLY_ACC=CAM_ASM_000533 /LENGTH=265 /DNA_ID=CAMNT_0042763427 /DNA_START=68 /DNA_END=865 /DNA_ORIENTATION=+
MTAKEEDTVDRVDNEEEDWELLMSPNAEDIDRKIEVMPLIDRYEDANKNWPGRGKVILCQRRQINGEEAILVYQAYRREIAKHACEHQSFEFAPGYKTTRMTWIKPNFLWMMYRSGWASKHNQEMILGIWLKLSFFHELLIASKCTQRRGEADAGVGERNRPCRLQWDPDHFPDGSNHPYRRALQLGIKGEYAARYASADPYISPILNIVDMTPLAREGYAILNLIKKDRKKAHLLNDLRVSSEAVYSDLPNDIAKQIGLDDITV